MVLKKLVIHFRQIDVRVLVKEVVILLRQSERLLGIDIPVELVQLKRGLITPQGLQHRIDIVAHVLMQCQRNYMINIPEIIVEGGPIVPGPFSYLAQRYSANPLFPDYPLGSLYKVMPYPLCADCFIVYGILSHMPQSLLLKHDVYFLLVLSVAVFFQSAQILNV